MMVQKLFSEERVKKSLGYHCDCCFREKSNLSNIQSVILHSCWKSEELLETNHTYGDMAPSLAWVGDKSPCTALACCIGNTYLLGLCERLAKTDPSFHLLCLTGCVVTTQPPSVDKCFS